MQASKRPLLKALPRRTLLMSRPQHLPFNYAHPLVHAIGLFHACPDHLLLDKTRNLSQSIDTKVMSHAPRMDERLPPL
jgi:hypothetical protein